MPKDTESACPDLVVEAIDETDIWARFNRTGRYAESKDRDTAARQRVEGDNEEDV